jgi:WD40 repeat protein
LALAFTIDGSLVATLYNDDYSNINIFVWNLRTNTREMHIKVTLEDEGEACLNELAYGHDGRYIAVGVNNTRMKEGFVLLLDTTLPVNSEGRVRRLELFNDESVGGTPPFRPAELITFAFSPDGSTLAEVFRNYLVLWTLDGFDDGGACARRTFAIPSLIGGGLITSVAYTSDGRQLVCTTRERVVTCDLNDESWNSLSTEGGLSRARVSLQCLDPLNSLALAQYQSSPQSFGLWADPDLFAIFDYNTGALVNGPFRANDLTQAVFSVRSEIVAASTSSGSIQTWDLASGGYLGSVNLRGVDRTQQVGTKVKCMRFSPTGEHLACTMWDGRVHIFRTGVERLGWLYGE